MTSLWTLRHRKMWKRLDIECRSAGTPSQTVCDGRKASKISDKGSDKTSGRQYRVSGGEPVMCLAD